MKILLAFFIFLSSPAHAQLNDDSSDAEKLLEKAVDFEQRKVLDSATIYYQQAAWLFQQGKAWKESVNALKNAGGLYFIQRKSSETIQSFTYLLDTLNTYLNDSLRGEFYFKIGLSHAREAQFVDALENMKQACLLREKVLDPNDLMLGESYHTLGRLYFTIGNYQQSLLYQQKYLEINQQNYPPDHMEVSDALHYVGLSYSRLHEHDLALEYYFRSMGIVEHADKKYHWALSHIYNNIGLVYGRQHLLEQELSYFLKSIAIKKQFGESIADSYHNLGRTYMEMDKYDESRKVLEEALLLKIEEVGEHHVTVSNTYHYLGELLIKQENYDSALYFAEKALAIRKENFVEYGTHLAMSHRQFAKIYQHQKAWNKALGHIQQALASLDKNYIHKTLTDHPSPDDDILDPLSLLQIMHYKSEVLMQRYTAMHRANDLKLAYQSSMAAADMIDHIYRNFNDPESHTYLSDHANKVWELALNTAFQLEQKEKDAQYLEAAFQLIESNKSQALLDNITASQWKRENVTDALLAQELELNTKLAYSEKLLFEMENEKNVDSTKIRDYKNQIFNIHRQQESLRQDIKEKYPQYFHIMHEQKFVSLAVAQQDLVKPNELMVEYFQGDSALYCLAISRKKVTFYKKEIQELPINEMLQGLQQRNYQLYSRAAYELYTYLLEEVIADNPSHQLIIIPDAQLGYLPFEALLTRASSAKKEDYKSLSYLMLDYTISYQYSANLLASGQTTNKATYSRAFAGYAPAFTKQQNPLLATRSAEDRQLVSELQALPFAEEEVRSIAQMLKGNAHINQDATESNFKASASDSRIIHLASHALIDDRNPLYSQLVFAPEEGSEEDGLLYTYELYNMHLNANMVTLSACNTGVGKVQKGEGIISLARGFMYAGVPNVLMSLWAVSDRSTSQLMQHFYQSLNQGDTKAEALRAAKLQYLEEADANTAAPYYWSGFVLISNHQNATESKFFWLYFILPVVALILASWMFIKRPKTRKTIKKQ